MQLVTPEDNQKTIRNCSSAINSTFTLDYDTKWPRWIFEVYPSGCNVLNCADSFKNWYLKERLTDSTFTLNYDTEWPRWTFEVNVWGCNVMNCAELLKIQYFKEMCSNFKANIQSSTRLIRNRLIVNQCLRYYFQLPRSVFTH